MFEYLDFHTEEGDKKSPQLTLFTLSTCGFCKKARGFLQDYGFTYRYLDLDLIEPDLKQKAKEEFNARFGRTLSYPTLVLGEKDFLIGFIRDTWTETLLKDGE